VAAEALAGGATVAERDAANDRRTDRPLASRISLSSFDRLGSAARHGSAQLGSAPY